MAVNQPSRQQLDQMLSDTALAVRTALENVTELKTLMDMAPDALFTTAGQGYEYTAGELASIRGTLTDLDKLRQIATAQATQAAASDFYVNARKIWGFRPARR